MRCNQHKRYKAKLRPRCDCVDCWQIFLEETATYNDVCKEIDRRTPKYSSAMSYAIDLGPNPIMDMLVDYKKKFDEDWQKIQNEYKKTGRDPGNEDMSRMAQYQRDVIAVEWVERTRRKNEDSNK